MIISIQMAGAIELDTIEINDEDNGVMYAIIAEPAENDAGSCQFCRARLQSPP